MTGGALCATSANGQNDQLKTPDVKSRREEALMFIRTAQKDAPAGSELRQLAQQEIQRLDAK